jgi:hypothetical protein
LGGPVKRNCALSGLDKAIAVSSQSAAEKTKSMQPAYRDLFAHLPEFHLLLVLQQFAFDDCTGVCPSVSESWLGHFYRLAALAYQVGMILLLRVHVATGRCPVLSAFPSGAVLALQCSTPDGPGISLAPVITAVAEHSSTSIKSI